MENIPNFKAIEAELKPLTKSERALYFLGFYKGYYRNVDTTDSCALRKAYFNVRGVQQIIDSLNSE